MMKYNPVFTNEKEFLFSIHKHPGLKIQELGDLLNFDVSEAGSYEMLKKVTISVMGLKRKSDKVFLLWLHYIGHHIKLKYSAKWALVRYSLPDELLVMDHFFPILIDNEKGIWKVGEFSLRAFYYEKILLGDSFFTYYKLHIERVISETKIADLHLEEDRLFFID